MSGLFCVTSFRTRECLPCAAVQLSQRTLRVAQFADANSATHKVLIMYHDRLPIFGRRSFYIPTSNQGGHSLFLFGLRKPLTPFVHWAHGEKNMGVRIAAACVVNIEVCTHSSGNELRGTVRTDKPYLFLSG